VRYGTTIELRLGYKAKSAVAGHKALNVAFGEFGDNEKVVGIGIDIGFPILKVFYDLRYSMTRTRSLY
jgi:hypothetical protein